MEQMESKQLTGFTLKQTAEWLGLKVEPGPEGWAVAYGTEGMDQQRFSRQCTVLMGYAALALGRMPRPGEQVPLESLHLPRTEGQDALAAVWFARACGTDDPKTLVLAVYNGFGAMPGGYPAVPAAAQRFLDKEDAERFLQWVHAAKLVENDLGEQTPELPTRAFWAEVKMAPLRAALRSACLEMER